MTIKKQPKCKVCGMPRERGEGRNGVCDYCSEFPAPERPSGENPREQAHAESQRRLRRAGRPLETKAAS